MNEIQRISREWFRHQETLRLLGKYINWVLKIPPGYEAVCTLPFSKRPRLGPP